MITDECSKKLNNYLTENQIEEYITKNQIQTEMNINSISVIEDGVNYIRLKIRGTRDETSYSDPSFYREIIFEDSLVLEKVLRTEKNPWGLIVDDWDEKVYKK